MDLVRVMRLTPVLKATRKVADVYERVASGDTRGSGGSFAADDQATLTHVSVPVEVLEELAQALGRKVHPRTNSYRKGGE